MTENYTIRKHIFYLIVLLVLAGCYPISGLKPIYPEVVKSHSKEGFFEVDSLQPTFRWESFPRPQDLRRDKDGLLSRIHNVTYDLKIWRAEHFCSGEIAYRRTGLPAQWHKIEEPLAPSTKYFWTIRARFEVDGRTRVTKWGGTYSDIRSPVVPNPYYYRFKTPSE